MAPTTLPPAARDDTLAAARARLHAFIARRVESADVAEDLTQEVLLRLVAHAGVAGEPPTAWLYRVARNVVIDHYRARSRRPPDGGPPPEWEPAEDPFAEDPRDAERELAACLRALVGQLAEPYRAAVTAADLDGRTQAEAARALGLSVSGMKSRVQRGRRRLRRLLTQCCHVQTGPTGSISGYEPGANCAGAAAAFPKGCGGAELDA